VVGFADLAELSYSVPEILIPIAGVFLGVIDLGATVIRTLYTRVGRLSRAVFALSSLLLMAPGLLSESVFDTLGLVGVSVSVNALLLDLTLRAVGFVLFVLFALRNRRTLDGEGDGAGETDATTGSTGPSPPPTRPERLGSNGIFDRQFGFAFFDDELSPSVCLGERSRSLVSPPNSPQPFVEDEPRLRRLDLVHLAGLRDELVVDRARVDGVDDEDDVVLAGDLPDEVHLLPVDHPLADGGGVDVHLHRNLDHRLHVASAGRDGEPLDDTLLSHAIDAIAYGPLEVPTWSAISV